MSYLAILEGVALLFFGAALWYYSSSAKLQGYVAGLITQAEAMYQGVRTGGEKRAWVVGKLYDMIPKPLRRIITREILEALVQGTFDAMEQYAHTQADKLVAHLVDREGGR